MKRAISPPQHYPMSVTWSHSDAAIPLLKKTLVWLGLWQGLSRAWSAVQEPPTKSRMIENIAALVQSCTQANLLLLLAASDLTQGCVDS